MSVLAPVVTVAEALGLPDAAGLLTAGGSPAGVFTLGAVARWDLKGPSRRGDLRGVYPSPTMGLLVPEFLARVPVIAGGPDDRAEGESGQRVEHWSDPLMELRSPNMVAKKDHVNGA